MFLKYDVDLTMMLLESSRLYRLMK